jgi:putative hydrolase of the HAD superfamily
MTKRILAFLLCLCTLHVQATTAHCSPAVVFDFGGVIAKADTDAMSDFLTLSFHIDKAQLSEAFTDMQNQGGSEEQFWLQFAANKHIVLPKDWIDQFGAIIQDSITQMPGTLDLVKELKRQHYQTAILSDMTQYQDEVIRKLGYFELFNPVVLSHENRVKKPNPEAFRILLSKLNKSPSCVIFIDDRIQNVEAARNQGIDAIHFTSSAELKEELVKRGFAL